MLIPAIGPLLDATLDATYPHWHDGLSEAAYRALFTAQLKTPYGSRHLTRWALVDDDRLLATVKLYEFRAQFGSCTVRAVGIGAVFTLSAYRGRGVASELMTLVLDKLMSDGVDLAFLFSEIDPRFYLRFGFNAVPLDDLSLRVIEDSRRGAPATMVRAGDDRDLVEMVSMDAERMQPFTFHLDRDRDVVQYSVVKHRLLAGLAPAGTRSLQWYVAEEGASAVAYVVISVKGNEWTIESCGDRDPAGARLGAILQVLIAREPSETRPRIRAWLPMTLRPPQVEIVERHVQLRVHRPHEHQVERAPPNQLGEPADSWT